MATQPTLEGSGATTTDGTTVSTASITPVADSNYLVIAWGRHATSSTDPSVPAISGWTGVTWEATDATNAHADRTAASIRIFSFRARVGASPPSAAALTATWGESLGGMGIAVFRLLDTDAGGSNGSGAIVQVNRAIDKGSGTLRQIAMAAEGSVDNGCIAFFIEGANAAPPLGSGWTSLHTANLGSPNWGVRIQWIDAVPSSVDDATSTSGWAGVAIELKHAAAGLTPVGRDLATSWHVYGAVGASLATSWHVYGAVGRDLSTSWNVLSALSAVGRSLDTSWHVRAAVGPSLATAWNVGVSVGRALDTSWHVRAAVGRSLDTGWNVGAIDTSPAWSILIRWDGVNWDEVGPDVRRITWQRGASGDFGAAVAGAATIELQNSAGRYLQFNPASPLYGQAVAGAEVLITCIRAGVVYPIFGGYLRTLKPVGSHLPSERRAQIACDDPLGHWDRREVTLAAQRAGVSIAAARGLVLDQIGVAAGQRQIGAEDEMIVFGELVEITDEAGNVVSTFEAGWTDSPASILASLNADGLGRHFIRPGVTTTVPWRYASVNRNDRLDAAADASVAYATDFGALDGFEVGNDTRVERVVVRPRQPEDGSSVEAVAGVAGVREVSIASPRIRSLANAQGVADHLQWRFDAERQRPRMLLQRRIPLMFERDLFDILAVTDERHYVSGRRMEIVGIYGSWGPGPLPEVTWTLQDTPEQPPLTTIFHTGRDSTGGPAVTAK